MNMQQGNMTQVIPYVDALNPKVKLVTHACCMAPNLAMKWGKILLSLGIVSMQLESLDQGCMLLQDYSCIAQAVTTLGDEILAHTKLPVLTTTLLHVH